MTTVPIWVIVIVLLAPLVGLLLLIEQAWIFLARRGARREAVQSVGKGVRMVVVAIAVIVLLVLATGLVLVIEEARFLFGGLSFTKSAKVTTPGQDRGYYYRFKASYAYKGEPLDFDIVVGCNVRVTTYKDNDRTVEIGVAPMVFGLKMKDGRGVVIRPPQACQGETTENGKVPAALLPLVVTYENADQPWFGLAYASEDAYESPISELKFFGATISRATREEWQEWRRTDASKNFITYELLGINPKNMWNAPKWKPGYRVMASNCFGASWVKLPEQVRNVVRSFWPSDKPVYWFPNWELRDALWKAAVRSKDPPLFEGSRFLDHLESSLGAAGLARRRPGAVVFFNRRVAGDVYPVRINPSVNQLGPDDELPSSSNTKSQLSWVDAEVKPELRGFAYCDDTIFAVEGVPGGIIVNRQMLLRRINGAAINEQLQAASRGSDLVFERDDDVILPHSYQLGSIFGGL